MYVFGASGHGKAVIELVESLEEIDGVFDDNPLCKEVLGYPVTQLGGDFPSGSRFFIAIGDNRIRREVFRRLNTRVGFDTLIHPTAIVSKRSAVGKGTVVMEGAIIKVDSHIGDQVIVNTGASVDHDCGVGDFVHLAPKATLCGGVTVGEGTIIGAGATVIPGIKIGSWCKIGAGSVVNRDVPDGTTWIGSGLK